MEARLDGTPFPEVKWIKVRCLLYNNCVIHVQDWHPLCDSQRVKLAIEGNVASCVITDVIARDAGAYTCVATNEAGRVTCVAPLAVYGIIEIHEIYSHIANTLQRTKRTCQLSCVRDRNERKLC